MNSHHQRRMRRVILLILASFIGLVVIITYSASGGNDFNSRRWETIIQNKIFQSIPFYKTFNSRDYCSTSNDWSEMSADTMTPSEIIRYLRWSGNNNCRLAHDFGGQMIKRYIPDGILLVGIDGQKSVCIDPPSIAPRTDGNCIVYSFGINGEWSFDEAMQDYGCQVFAFDPSMNETDHDHSERIRFYSLALDSIDSEDGKNLTLDSIYKMLNQEERTTAIIDYLKIDVDMAEWHILPQILQSPDKLLNRVKQLAIEIHLEEEMPGGLNDYRQLISILKSLEEDDAASMVRFSSKLNPWCVQSVPALDNYTGPTCFELAWYNSKFLFNVTSLNE